MGPGDLGRGALDFRVLDDTVQVGGVWPIQFSQTADELRQTSTLSSIAMEQQTKCPSGSDRTGRFIRAGLV